MTIHVETSAPHRTVTRHLLDAAIEACVRGERPHEVSYGIVATSSVDLASRGVAETLRRALAGDELCVSAAELAQRSDDLSTLILVELDEQGDPGRTWALDGWSLIRTAGEGLDLRGARLRGALLRGARLKGADLRDADLSGADLEKADLSRTALNGASFAGAILLSASLNGADLTEAEFYRADLRHADLRGADCSRTAFGCADFWNAYLWNVDLSAAFTDRADPDRADHLNDTISDQPRQKMGAR